MVPDKPTLAFRRHCPMRRLPGEGAVQTIAPERPARGGRYQACLSPASPHAPDRGDITRGGNPLPVEENHAGPSTGLPRRSGGNTGEIPGGAQAREGERGYTLFSPTPPALRAPPPPRGRGSADDCLWKGRPGEAAPIMPFPGIFPCTGPWGYHPGRGRGGNPLPVEENHTGPPSGPPRRSGGYRGKIPGRAQAREGERGYTLFSPTPPALRAPPPPRGGGSADDCLWKGRPGEAAPIILFAGIPPCTGPWRYHPGRGRGGNPLPVEKNHTGPSPGPPRRIGGYRGESPGRAQSGRKPIHRPPISPTPPALRAPPPPRGGGSAGDSPGKAGPGSGPDYTLPRHHPMHRTVGISPGEGPGREPPPRRKEPYWPSLGAPAQDRGISW